MRMCPDHVKCLCSSDTRAIRLQKRTPGRVHWIRRWCIDWLRGTGRCGSQTGSGSKPGIYQNKSEKSPSIDGYFTCMVQFMKVDHPLRPMVEFLLEPLLDPLWVVEWNFDIFGCWLPLVVPRKNSKGILARSGLVAQQPGYCNSCNSLAVGVDKTGPCAGPRLQDPGPATVDGSWYEGGFWGKILEDLQWFKILPLICWPQNEK